MRALPLVRLLAAMALASAPVVGALVVAPVAHATQLAALSVEQLTDAATFVVRGTVTSVWTEKDDDGLLWTRARVRVTERLKGRAPEEVVVASLGGRLGDEVQTVPGAAGFSVGEDNLLFLTEAGRERHLVPVAKFLGKLIVRRAPGESTLYAMRFAPEVAISYDARFLPHAPIGERLELREVVATIQDRVARGWDGQPIPGLSPERLRQINTPEARSVR